MIGCMATIVDVAQGARVSIATVSRVLSPGVRPHRVKAETAQRVREVAGALDFVPSALARGLASRRSGLLGLLVPDLADAHYPWVARGAEDAARSEGLAVLVCNTLGDDGRFCDYLNVLRARRVDALILSGTSSLGPTNLAALAASGLPAVVVGRLPRRTGIPWVAVDNRAAGRDVTKHLWEGGRRRIVHLAGPLRQSSMADRAAGYRAYLRSHGLRPVVISTTGESEGGLRAMRALLRERQVDAVFAATDRLAIATLAAAHDAGLRVPTDLAVVGFDDLPMAPYLRPSLSSVAQPTRELGALAVQLVCQMLTGVPVRPLTVAARLCVRASSGGGNDAAC